MNICQNCGTANKTQTQKCDTCKMELQAVITKTNTHQEEDHLLQNIITCVNCGNKTSSLLSQCNCCHFPIIPPLKNHQKQTTTSLRLLEKTA